jgi:hypothetical protein
VVGASSRSKCSSNDPLAMPVDRTVRKPALEKGEEDRTRFTQMQDLIIPDDTGTCSIAAHSRVVNL